MCSFIYFRSADETERLYGLFHSRDRAHETSGSPFHKGRFVLLKNKSVSGTGIESEPILLLQSFFLIGLIPDLHICLLAGLYKC